MVNLYPKYLFNFFLNLNFKQQSSFNTAKLIYKEGGFGLNGLNRGLTSTLGNNKLKKH